MDNIQKASFRITGIESKSINGTQVFTLLNDKTRYQFWSKKKDGSDTKAYEQFQKFRFMAGDQVNVSFNVTESGSNPHTGKPYINRTIVFFDTVDDNTPNTVSASDSNGTNEIPVIRTSATSSTAEIPTIYIDGFNDSDKTKLAAVIKDIAELRQEIKVLAQRMNEIEIRDIPNIDENPF